MLGNLKKKRISKKNKSAWRKTDIQDVEDFLEVQRQNERIGSMKNKTDDELFIIDTPTKALKTTSKVLSEKQKRILRAKTKKLRHLEALENKSQVQDPISKRNHVRLKRKVRNVEEEVCNPTKPRHFAANAARQKYYQSLEERVKAPKSLPAKDVWEESKEDKRLQGFDHWVGPELALHVVNNLGHKIVKAHESLRHKTTKSSKFMPPHPGTSANPSLEDHQELIAKVVTREENIIKEEKHLKRVTTQMFSKLTPIERDQRYIEEMSGEPAAETEPKPVIETIATSSGIWTHVPNNELAIARISVNPPVQNKKKSRRTRRKQTEQKMLKLELSLKKQLKKQITDIHRIKHINAEVNAEQQRLIELLKHRKKAAEKKKLEPKRLSRTKYMEPDIDFTLPDEIPGNLRNVNGDVNLLADVFHNFQRRNILPASVLVSKPKNRKVKRFVRSSHKEAPVTFQMLRDKRHAEAKAAAKISKPDNKL